MSTHIRVVTPLTTKSFRDESHFDDFQSDSLHVSQVSLDRGPASIECALDEALSVPDTIAKTIEAERDGADAVVIDCMGDPGLDAAREVVKIPVFGPSQVAMYTAAMLGHNFGVVTVLESVHPLLDNLARLYGMAEKYVSFRAVDIPVLELETDPERLDRKLAEEALHAVQKDGAQTIILGCTGMLGCACNMTSVLEQAGLAVPVIDPVPVAIRVAAAIVESGLTTSKLTYPTPPKKTYTGYDL